MKNKILSLLADVKKLENSNIDEVCLPGNVYYLNETDILCLERDRGESRYPYDMDGLNLWIHSNGHIDCNESNLQILRLTAPQEETSIDFWGGIKDGDKYIPISITGATMHSFEPEGIKRYTIYSKRAAYYIAETPEYIFAVRANVTSDKQINFTVSAINKTSDEASLYIASYVDPILRFRNTDTDWSPLKRYGKLYENGSAKITRYSDPEDNDQTNIAVINKTIISANGYDAKSTVSKTNFVGRLGRCLTNSLSLKNGEFPRDVHSVNTSDMAASGDIVKFTVNPSDEVIVNININITHDENEAELLTTISTDINKIEEDIKAQEQKEELRLYGLDIKFSEFKDGKINNVLFNRFLNNVKKQIDLCALGKNYAGNMLGVRDVFQQLTAANIWNQKDVRRKIVLCLNYIMSNGRAPRQFSVPAVEGVIPKFDIRQFIDQGLWIIETLHKYISRTNDYSILEEKCSYYEIIDENKAIYKKSDCVDSVLDHLLKITNYLISNIDERTNCLKILFGDWNDAVCGLGKTEDKDKEFGTGVSVMATLQLYRLLKEMKEILNAVGGYDDKCVEYESIREKIAEGLEKHAIQKDGERRHIMHGWGDKGSYNVGSLKDTDGVTRYSINPFSFWCISEMINRDLSFKEDVMKAYDVLDSKYGLMTFDKHFPSDMHGVGRIATLTPGTAENACTYVHATTFAIMALFIIGEPEKAWEQIFKIIPLTHKYVTKTPFVMPNSYCYNEDYQMDGESMGDWYTGSGAVLLRCIYEYVLGIQAMPDGVKFATAGHMPTDEVVADIVVKGKKVKFIYKNKKLGERKYFVNGIEQKSEINAVSNTKTLFVKNEEFEDNMIIEVVD